MSGQHTMGPWRTMESSPSLDPYSITSDSGIVAKIVAADDTELREARANARLIAAAPCLLASLQKAVLQNSHDMLMTGEELRQCASVIARATGETQ